VVEVSGTQSEIKRISAEIHDCFADTNYPGDANLVERLPDGSVPAGSLKAYEILRGRRWDEVNLDQVWLLDLLDHLSPRPRHYYLPALLLDELRHPEDVSDGFWTFMTPTAGAEEHYARRFGALTERQIAAIEETLSLFVALDSYLSEIATIIDFWLHYGWRKCGSAVLERDGFCRSLCRRLIILPRRPGHRRREATGA